MPKLEQIDECVYLGSTFFLKIQIWMKTFEEIQMGFSGKIVDSIWCFVRN